MGLERVSNLIALGLHSVARVQGTIAQGPCATNGSAPSSSRFWLGRLRGQFRIFPAGTVKGTREDFLAGFPGSLYGDSPRGITTRGDPKSFDFPYAGILDGWPYIRLRCRGGSKLYVLWDLDSNCAGCLQGSSF